MRELHRSFTQDIRVVSRKPERINDTDELVAADLTDTSPSASRWTPSSGSASSR